MRAPTFVISRSEAEDSSGREFEDKLIALLRKAERAPVLVVPSPYSLAEGDPALDALREVQGDLVLATRLFPRAAYWVLHTLGVRGAPDDEEACKECVSSENCFCGDRKIRAYSLASFDTPESAAARLLNHAPRRKTDAMIVREVSGESRAPWYPVIDYSLCVVCGQCHDFCLFGVYTTDDANQPRVTSPESCKPGCAACARICPQGAVMFPLYAGDDGIAGAPGMKPKAEPIVPEAFFRRGEPCPVCGCACDCERSTDGTAPPGKTVCPACGCLCNPSQGACACRPLRVGGAPASEPTEKGRDELDDLIDELDRLDV